MLDGEPMVCGDPDYVAQMRGCVVLAVHQRMTLSIMSFFNLFLSLCVFTMKSLVSTRDLFDTRLL